MVQGTVVSLAQGDNDVYAADDNLGTPRDFVNSSGTLVNHDVYSVFGEVVYSSAPSLTYWAGFGGGHADSITGLVNDYERWYNPATGNWESQDPKGFAARDANLERYVGNNPATAIDPLGLATPPSPLDDLQSLAQQQADAAKHKLDETNQLTFNNTLALQNALNDQARKQAMLVLEALNQLQAPSAMLQPNDLFYAQRHELSMNIIKNKNAQLALGLNQIDNQYAIKVDLDWKAFKKIDISLGTEANLHFLKT